MWPVKFWGEGALSARPWPRPSSVECHHVLSNVGMILEEQVPDGRRTVCVERVSKRLAVLRSRRYQRSDDLRTGQPPIFTGSYCGVHQPVQALMDGGGQHEACATSLRVASECVQGQLPATGHDTSITYGSVIVEISNSSATELRYLEQPPSTAQEPVSHRA